MTRDCRHRHEKDNGCFMYGEKIKCPEGVQKFCMYYEECDEVR
jgi:predicted metal-binding protein